MDGSHFDDLTRSLTESRRSLLGGTLALVGGWLGVANVEARKKHKKRKPKKPNPNAYGCLDAGKACNGDSANCCSGICEGNTPKKGKKDASRCVAHDTGICKVDMDVCSTGEPRVCNGTNTNCVCFLTTGNAGFCGDLTGDAASFCRDCSQDTDCAEEFGSGAACVVLGGICESLCPATGGTACVQVCTDAAM